MRKETYKAVIIDDEQNAIDVLRLLLIENCPEVQICGSTISSETGIELIRKELPDIVFLDIEMPKLNGFQLLEQVSDLYFCLIFTTAYDQYALKAFKFSALDYLLKPIISDELKAAVVKVLQGGRKYQEKVDVMQQGMKSYKSCEALERIILPHARGYLFQRVDEIIYCEAYNTYTKFFLEAKPPIMISKPLAEIDDILNLSGFFRTHRQFLVNTKKIIEFVRTEGGFVVMSNGAQIPISRNKRQEFIDECIR
ncbi:response regulator transcription factor [Segetibacter sp. 3557_3]|uniref:LytR/AlgR family response regulator transcription factor n=1 Tax=Segetibacter sp. 3557_3 TaxID=2547429 RepID=UPI00105903BF|nr:LytTR family DNA-binding domain-containing protein [Segetibacter sp. 3557_3]TDH28091.1 response regulator transcription factor [Segetibacter sp. 3557_3]